MHQTCEEYTILFCNEVYVTYNALLRLLKLERCAVSFMILSSGLQGKFPCCGNKWILQFPQEEDDLNSCSPTPAHLNCKDFYLCYSPSDL